MVIQMEIKKLNLDLDPEKIRTILDVIANSKFYTKPFADELGRAVAEFYKEMLQDQVPDAQAAEFTRDYISFIRFPTDIENALNHSSRHRQNHKLGLELEYHKKLAQVYKEVNEKLWDLVKNLNIVHTVEAKPLMATKPEKTGGSTII